MHPSFKRPHVIFLLSMLVGVLLYLQLRPVSETIAIRKHDPNWDLKALSALVSLMQDHPYASNFAVKWDKGEKDLAGFSYSIKDHKLAFQTGAYWLADRSLLGDTSVQINQSDLAFALSKGVRYPELVRGWKRQD